MARRKGMSMTRLARMRPNTISPGSKPDRRAMEADRLLAMEETKKDLEAQTAARTLDSSAASRRDPEAELKVLEESLAAARADGLIKQGNGAEREAPADLPPVLRTAWLEGYDEGAQSAVEPSDEPAPETDAEKQSDGESGNVVDSEPTSEDGDVTAGESEEKEADEGTEKAEKQDESPDKKPPARSRRKAAAKKAKA